MKDNLRRDLLQRRMTRKEFLGIIGGSMLALFGLGRLVSLLQQTPKTNEVVHTDPVRGFGSRKFGG
jgi:hypothetical protein